MPVTLSKKHQLTQASTMREDITQKIYIGPKKFVLTETLPFKHLFSQQEQLMTTKWIEIHGIRYCVLKCLLAIKYNEENLPEFGALHSICLINAIPHFVCKKVKTVEHNMLVMAYKIEILDEFIQFEVENLLTHHIFHAHCVGDEKFVIVKRALGNLH